jgi:hypothetical protein
VLAHKWKIGEKLFRLVREMRPDSGDWADSSDAATSARIAVKIRTSRTLSRGGLVLIFPIGLTLFR